MPIIPAYNTDQTIRKQTDIITQLRQDVDQLMSAARVNQLNYSSINNTALPIFGVDSSGIAQLKTLLGKQPDGTYAVTYHNGDAPPNPINIGVAQRQLGILVSWDGTFAGNIPKPEDFDRLDVYIDTTSGFTPSTTNLMGSLFTDSALFIGADVTPHFVKVATVNTSGVASFPSFEIPVTPLPAGQLAAGSVTAITLDAELILVTNIIIGDPFGSHISLNPIEGMQFYDSGGSTRIVDINIASADAKFTGDVSTQIGPDKVVLTNSTGDPEIQLFRLATSDRAYVTAVGQSSDSTIDLVLHPGPDHTFTPNREVRLSLQPELGEVTYADRPTGNNRGGRLVVSRTVSALEVRKSDGSNVLDGGSVSASNNGVYTQYFTGSTERSTMQLSDGFAALQARNSGGGVKSFVSVDQGSGTIVHADTALDMSGTNSLRLGTTGRMRMHGQFGDLIADGIDNDEAFFTGEAFFTYPGGATWTGGFTYGPTMLTAPRPIINVDGQPECKWTSYGASTTGFRFVTDSNISRFVRFICVRP